MSKHKVRGAPCTDENCWCKTFPKKEDVINNPSHYKIPGTDMEALDVIKGSLTEKEYIGYLRGNILKYHIRARIKGGKESMLKAHYYSKELEKVLNAST